MLGWYATSVETRVGPQEFSIGISQTIPFPSKLSAKRDIASTLAARARIAYERTVRDVRSRRRADDPREDIREDSLTRVESPEIQLARDLRANFSARPFIQLIISSFEKWRPVSR